MDNKQLVISSFVKSNMIRVVSAGALHYKVTVSDEGVLQIPYRDSACTQIWRKADQADATGQAGVPQRSDRWSVL
jgi:purine-nucleoside phosphorylase